MKFLDFFLTFSVLIAKKNLWRVQQIWEYCTIILVYLINKYMKTLQAFCEVLQAQILCGAGCNPEIVIAGLNNELLI